MWKNFTVSPGTARILSGRKPGDLGSRRYTAIVAKATPISGQSSVSAGTIGKVQSQVREAFGLEFSDPADTGSPSLGCDEQDNQRDGTDETVLLRCAGVRRVAEHSHSIPSISA